MSPTKPRTERDIQRDLDRLQLQYMRRELSMAQYERRMAKLVTELPPAEMMSVSDYIKDAERYGAVYTSVITTDSTNKMDMDTWKKFNDYLKNAAMTGLYDYSSSGIFPRSNNYKTIAEQAWDEHGGVVMCECDNLDCERVIEITKEEYVHASTPGYRRLTHPDCGYGIINSTLVERKPKWNIWDKGY